MTAFVQNTTAFSPNSIRRLGITTQSKTSLDGHAIDTEDEAMYFMMKAVDCANSDTCSIDEAQHYMKEIIHIQSGCASGTLVGQDVCENPVFASEVIASLREKIENGAQKTTGQLNGGEFILLASLYFVMYLSGVLTHNNADDLMPFSSQEWIWALRDGYFPDMIAYSLRHNMDGVEPFTAQEWWWALRDGYLPDMLASSFKNGGMMI